MVSFFTQGDCLKKSDPPTIIVGDPCFRRGPRLGSVREGVQCKNSAKLQCRLHLWCPPSNKGSSQRLFFTEYVNGLKN